VKLTLNYFYISVSLFDIIIEELSDAKRKHEDDADLIASLRRLVDDPDPAIDFGSKGQPWSFEVFELCATMLSDRPNCHSAANMLEGILTKLFPKRKIRCPSAKAFEIFWMMMYPFTCLGTLYCMSKAKRWHGIGDESRKGSASMFSTGMKGGFETPDGLESHNALFAGRKIHSQPGCERVLWWIRVWGSFLVNAFTFISFWVLLNLFNKLKAFSFELASDDVNITLDKLTQRSMACTQIMHQR
jgi:hypothetical protein